MVINKGFKKKWRETTLGEILSEKGYIRGPFGSSLKRGEMEKSGIPVYEQQNAIYNNRDFRYYIGKKKHLELHRFTVQENDILISCSGTIGKTTIIKKSDPKGIISQALLILRPNPQKVDINYLNHYLNSKEGQYRLIGASHGSVQVNIAKRKDVENIPLSLPPLSEQKRIANILSSFDNKIEQLKKENNILENIAQTIFKEWFVNYNFPNKDGKPYKDSGGKMIDSELGLIPEGWRVASLTEIAEFTNGLPMQKYRPKKDEDFLPVIKIREMRNGYTNDTEKATINLDTKYIVNDGDVIFSWSGSIDLAIWKYGKGALNQHLFKVSSNKYPKWFYFHWIKHYLPEFRQIAEEKATTMGHIQRRHLEEALAPIPNEIPEQFTFLFDKTVTNNTNIERYKRIQQLLLNLLIKPLNNG